MPQLLDLTDPRYLNEVGWFLYHEKYGPITLGSSFDEERTLFSQLLLDEVLSYCGQDRKWLESKTVVSVGCGCTGDLATWPAAVKIGFDPLLHVYQKLGMLVDDAPGTSRTVYLAVGVEELPLLDGRADLVICRNALDHMLHPDIGVKEIWRILKNDGRCFLSVDIGGSPTPDEPTVFSPESLSALLQDHFEIMTQTDKHDPFSKGRDHSVRLLARKKHRSSPSLDKDTILQAYEAGLG
jgi:SAM-dependent methyltransferase